MAHARILRIHRVAGGDQAHQPTGSHQIQRAAKEVVVDAETGVGPIAHVGDLVLAKRHIADHEVEPVVGEGGLLEGGNPHIHAARCIQRLQHASGQLVDLDRRDAALLGDGRWHRADEVADARSGLQNASAIKAKALHGLPDGLDHVDFGVVAVIDRCTG